MPQNFGQVPAWFVQQGSRAAFSALLLAGLAGCLFTDEHALERARATLEQQRLSAPAPTEETDVGVRELGDWAALPHLRTDSYEQFSSYNRRPDTASAQVGGKDFNNFIALSGSEGALPLSSVDGQAEPGPKLGGWVLAATDGGPGYVSRVFFTRVSLSDLLAGGDLLNRPGLGRFDSEVLRVFVDDLAKPVADIPLADVGAASPFAGPLAGRWGAATVSYTPISFRQRLRLVLANTQPFTGYFYHVDVKRISEPTRSFTLRLGEDPAFSAAHERLGAHDRDPAGEVELLHEREPLTVPAAGEALVFEDLAAGTLRVLAFQVAESEAYRLRELQLRAFFDGAAEPAIDVPLDAFFGLREARSPYRTFPMQVEQSDNGLTATCFLPAPYRESARIVLANCGAAAVPVAVTLGVARSHPAEPWGYLHARSFGVSGPQPAGSRFEVLRVSGRGRYVGTFLFAAGQPDWRLLQGESPLNILEGNELGIVDGAPRIRGTGTEDYYNGAFYFATGPSDSPLAAANHVQRQAGLPGVVSCCRWHVLTDAIDFQQSFVLRFQYAADNPAVVERYATVAYYYLDRPEPGAVYGGTWTGPAEALD